MRTVLKYLKYVWVFAAAGILFLFMQAMTELMLPNMMSDLVDEGLVRLEGSTEQMKYILIKGLQMLGVALISVGGAIGTNYFSTKTAANLSKKLRHDVFQKVMSFSSREFDDFSTASLITRTTNDIQQLQNMLTAGIRMLFFAPFMGLGSITMAIRKSISMTWILGIAVITLLGFLLLILALAINKIKALQKLIDKINLISRENLNGIMVIRAFGNEEYEENRFEKTNNELRLTNRFVQRSISIMQPVMNIIMNMTTLAVVWFGAKAISADMFQVGDMMAYISYAMHVIISFMFVALTFVSLPRAMVSVNRIAEILNTEVSIKENEEPSEQDKFTGKIDFKNVCYRYDNADDDALKDISFSAEPGKTTAIVGATGSGKSTLINLIPRFFDVTSGEVLIDGIDVKKLKLEQLRAIIGLVPQKCVLFSGTVESNIKFGNENASKEDIRTALAIAQADFVWEMENKEQTVIEQGGKNVSGGQRQRLAIARALVKKPPIYIFDDSFSALDLKTDAALRKALSDYTVDSTVIIVAQRISTIMNADQIIVLDEGKIAGKGTHKELMQNCAEYIEIAQSQLSKEELEK